MCNSACSIHCTAALHYCHHELLKGVGGIILCFTSHGLRFVLLICNFASYLEHLVWKSGVRCFPTNNQVLVSQPVMGLMGAAAWSGVPTGPTQTSGCLRWHAKWLVVCRPLLSTPLLPRASFPLPFPDCK